MLVLLCYILSVPSQEISAARNTAVADLFDPAIQSERFYISIDTKIARQRRIFTTDGSLKLIKLGP